MDDICQICGSDPTGIVRIFESHPFIDGRTYDLICFTCSCVPKYWYTTKQGEVITLTDPDPEHMRTVAEMLEDGWDKRDAERSIKAIQRKLQSPKIHIFSDHDQNIFAQLFLENQKEMILDL